MKGKELVVCAVVNNRSCLDCCNRNDAEHCPHYNELKHLKEEEILRKYKTGCDDWFIVEEKYKQIYMQVLGQSILTQGVNAIDLDVVYVPFDDDAHPKQFEDFMGIVDNRKMS